MDREQEHRALDIFMDGLREYMKHDGKFMGKPITSNWRSLSEQDKDSHINAIFIRHAVTLTRLAHYAIHNLI